MLPGALETFGEAGRVLWRFSIRRLSPSTRPKSWHSLGIARTEDILAFARHRSNRRHPKSLSKPSPHFDGLPSSPRKGFLGCPMLFNLRGSMEGPIPQPSTCFFLKTSWDPVRFSTRAGLIGAGSLHGLLNLGLTWEASTS